MHSDLSEHTALVLAGGLGTRLRAMVADRPKVLADVAGRPFIFRILDQLVDAGIARVVLCTGYRGDQIPPVVGSRYRGVRITYSQESEPRGTGGALRLAWPHLQTPAALVVNGDSHCDAGLAAFARWHATHPRRPSLILAYAIDTRRYGRVTTRDDGRVTGFEEKGSATGPGWINAGIYVIPRSLLAGIPEDRAVSLERELFPAWIAAGLWGFRSTGRVLDIGTPDSYVAAQEALAGDPRAAVGETPTKDASQ